MRAARALAVVGVLCGPAAAQDAVPPVPSPVLMVQQDRLFDTSAFGKAAQARIEAESQALITENRQIEQQLEAEERSLTERRATLPPDQFRALAEEFNARVEVIRAEQDAKSRDIARSQESDRKRFIEAALPVLAELLREKGAVVILDRQAVFLSLDTIDITDEAVARIDARIGSGGAAP